MSPFADRMDRARAVMAEDGISVLLVSIGPELPYLTGYEAMDTERLTMLVVGPGETATVVIPELEAPRIEASHFAVDILPCSRSPLSKASAPRHLSQWPRGR